MGMCIRHGSLSTSADSPVVPTAHRAQARTCSALLTGRIHAQPSGGSRLSVQVALIQTLVYHNNMVTSTWYN